MTASSPGSRHRARSFSRAIQAVARLNIGVRTAERVLVELASFPAADFNALFDQTGRCLGRISSASAAFAGYSPKIGVVRYSGLPESDQNHRFSFAGRAGTVARQSSWLRIRPWVFAHSLALLRIGIDDGDSSGDGLHKRLSPTAA